MSLKSNSARKPSVSSPLVPPQSTAKLPIRSTSDLQIHLQKFHTLFQPLPFREGFLLSTGQPTRSCRDQVAGTAIRARYGESELSDSVGILQGSRRFGLEQYVSVWWFSCPVDPYCADLFSNARSGTDPGFCDVLDGQRHRLLQVEWAADEAKDSQQTSSASRQQQKARCCLE